MYQSDNANDLASEAPATAVESADAGQPADTTGVVDDAAPEPAAAGRPDLTASFLAEIARAMRETAVQERERISATVAEGTVAHEQKVRDRATSEATELRRMADDDVERIERTAAEEIQRIKDDAERQVGERRGALAEYLERHAALIDTEIGRIHGAVADYGSELDGFFGRLAEEQNPAEIARLAGLLPEPPDLDQVGAIARADAVDQIAHEATEAEAAEAIAAEAGDTGAIEPASTEAAAATGGESAATVTEPEAPVVGVMDPDAGTPVFDESGAPAETDAEAVPAGFAEEEPAQAASPADEPGSTGISAARLLRNLAPWTSSDRPPDDNPD
jgi:hypothetical protein